MNHDFAQTPRLRGLAFFLVLTALGTVTAGCASTVTVLNDAGGTDGGDGGGGGTDAGPTTDAPVACGSTTCAPGLACCADTGSCYDPRCLSCCMPRPDAGTTDAGSTDAGDAGGSRVCTSASDCNVAAGEGCLFPAAGCGITGVCGPVTEACGRVLGSYCGCDGQTFLETCSGPDRPWVHQGACHTPCVSNGDCLEGQSCCGSTGQCYDSTCLACCGAAADGGARSCTQASDCDTAANEDCIYSASGCGITGVCQVVYGCGRPSLPYCGCDGQTFYDTCAGPNHPWVSSGACPTPCGSSADCPLEDACCNGQCVPLSSTGGCPVTDGGVSVDAGTVDGGIGTSDGGVSTGDGGGVPACRSDLDCGSGQTCCTSSGRCYDPACLACCF